MMNMYDPPLDLYCDFDPMDDWVHVDELKKYDDAEDYLKKVLDQFYNVGSIDALEDALEELANVFNINLPNKKPKLIKKEDELYDLSVHSITVKINLPKKMEAL